MGDNASDNGSPSLATVVDRLRPRPGRNLVCLVPDFNSDFGVGRPSTPRAVLLPGLLIRKKFLSLVGRWLFGDSVPCLLEEKDRLEKFRFSVVMATGGQLNGSALRV